MSNVTPKGNVSAKVAPGFTFKRYLRTEKIARLELGGFSDADIAFSQGITIVRVGQIKRTPQYLAIRTSVASGVVADADKNLMEDLDNNHAILREMVPEALLALRDAILDKNNPALRLRAAQDLLDREGTVAKVSKTEVKHKAEYDFNQHDALAGSLLDALKTTESQRGRIEEDLGLNEFAKANLDKEGQASLQKAFDIISDYSSDGHSIN